MKKFFLLLFVFLPFFSPAQTAPFSEMVDDWEISVRQMDPSVRNRISETMAKLRGNADDRSLLLTLGTSLGATAASSLVEAIVEETYNLINYRKKQQREWQQMINKENVFSDSLTYVKGLTDFYKANSPYGALDPSDINFDGIVVRGMRNGQEVIYMSCSIDRDNLDHMFRHSKFNLVLDTLRFYPLQCHLPNLTANGLSSRGDLTRPGSGGNGYAFDERNNLKVTIDFSLYSSWINEAVQVHKDVELGDFRFNIRIPDNTEEFVYIREDVMEGAKAIADADARRDYLDRNLIGVEGDSFIVPRSFMPLPGGKPMWGTGEYNMKVKITETCSFNPDSEKGRRWHDDYKAMRKMQNRKGEAREYFETVWRQYGDRLVKTSYTTLLNTAKSQIPYVGSPAPAKK